MKKLFIIATIAMGLATTSCDSYLDINQDPNSPQEKDMTPSILFPATEMSLTASYGDLFRIPAGYHAQQFAQEFGTSNYLDYSRFTMSATRSSTGYWQLMARTLKNLETVRKLATENEEWGTYLAATTLRAFGFQALVDAYGEVPFSEAFQGSANPSPKYDDGKDIYAALIAELEDALSKASANDPVATNFLFPGERAGAWISFAKSLLLKLMMRESGVVDVTSKLDALVAQGDFIDFDVAYEGCWKNESGQMSPYYAEEFSTAWGSTQINVIANIALVGTMQEKNADGDIVYQDPRLAAFYNTNASGEFTGGVSGTNFSTAADSYPVNYWCRPKASYDMPVYLLTYSEVEFFLSEYYAKKGDATNAAAHYNGAIGASFATAGVAGAGDYVARYPYDQSNYKKVLGIAKWVALAGVNNFEAWCEMRRLDYPAFGTVKGTDIYDGENADSYHPERYQPGTLYTPIQVFGQVGPNKILERWPYPSNSASANGNAPKFTDADYVKPVFWGM
ncbi:MAG: SusD/RagB family nutrient-binding outer membrane lipoprotein [Prevotella sp.]|nr:SusD/RagB family nutrient-binding outer membrane lipoprotein [Prevotella sp.]